MEREWTTVRDDPNYEVTRSGSVRNSKTGNVLKPSLNNSGYLFVNMGPKHHRFSRSVHRLVAEAYVDGYAPGLDVNHKNGDKQDNRAENLEFCSRSENIRHAYRTGLAKGHKVDYAGTQPKRVKIVETGEEFESQAECARALNASVGSISMVANGKRESYKGYHIQYINE